MKAFVTSIGETTTELACWQLRRLGFDVICLDKQQTWVEKYSEFIVQADEPCLRVDADVLVNSNIIQAVERVGKLLMGQWFTYDLYQNDIGNTSPVYYSQEALRLIKPHLGSLHPTRPEATAWRLPRINPYTYTGQEIVGIHGFFQDEASISRHIQNKRDRKQNHNYDWEFVLKVKEFYGQLDAAPKN
jgi:hypothetical protein